MIPVYEKLRLLRKVPIFADIEAEDVLALAEKMSEQELGEAEVVFRQGDAGDDLCVVAQGVVGVFDGDTLLARFGAAEFFGELALLDHQPRSADAVALEPTLLLRLRSADFDELTATRPAAVRAVLRVLAARLRSSGQRVERSSLSPLRSSPSVERAG